jgi:hypothetical protein
VVGGTLPQGLNLDPTTGQITGTPLKTGDFTATIRVGDFAGNATGDDPVRNPDKQIFIKVTGPLSVTTTALPDGGVDLPYQATLNAIGGLPPYTWALAPGSSLPGGLTLAASGLISGAPTTAGTTSFTFVVTDSDTPPRTLQQAFTLKIVNQLGIVENTIPNGTRNQPYTTIFRSQYGTPPFSWRVMSGDTLPTNLTLNGHGSYATLDGIPDTPGSYTFNLAVTDSAAQPLEVIRPYTLTIAQDVQITTSGLKAAVTGALYSETITATGGYPPYQFSIIAGNPPGLTLDPDTGILSGTSTLDVRQSAVFTVKVTDAGALPAGVEKQFTIYGIAPLTITTVDLPAALQKTPYTTTLTGTGGHPPLSWSVVGGALPLGLTLGSDGILSGSAITCGIFPVTVQLADSAPVPTTTPKMFTVTVTCADNYIISGNTGVANATVALAGAASPPTTTSGADGSYNFGNLTNGSYTVTPSRTGFTFTPASRVVTVNNLDVTVPAFTASDIAPPVITTFALPSTSSTLIVSVTIDAQDNAGITGYFLSVTGITPGISTPGWSASLPTAFTFTGRGPRTLYAWVKDAAGNLSARSSADVTIEYQLSVTLNGTGGGSINSSPVGIHCTTGTCTATYTPTTPVKLTQLTDGVSFFTTWGGACSGAGTTCDVAMIADKTVIATYTAAPRAKIGSAEYSSLKAAYDVAPKAGVTTILTLDALLTESLTVNKQLIIVGGQNITYTGRTGQPTELKGTLTIGKGSLIVDGLAVR